MRARLKNLLKNLALSAASLLVCVLLLEGVLRLAGYGRLEIYQPDPVLYWKLKPGQDCFTKIDHKPVHINSEGTRGPEFAPEKPAGTIRILSLGDSKTFGWGVSGTEAYSGRLEILLQSWVGRGRKVEVINAGVNAWSYPQMLNYVRSKGLSYRPDFLILADANFWTQFSEQSSPAFVKKFMRRVWLKNVLRRFAIYHYVVEVKLKRFYEAHRTRFIPVDPAKDTLFKEEQKQDPAALVENSIREICRLALSHSIKPVLVFIPFVDPAEPAFQIQVRDAKRRVSEELRIPFVDFSAESLSGGKTLYLPDDPAHLNVRGNEIMAGLLFKTVTNLISL